MFTLPVLAFGFEAVTGIAIDVSPVVMFLFVLVILPFPVFARTRTPEKSRPLR